MRTWEPLTSFRAIVFALPNIEVRVGSYDFDNTGHIYSGYYTGSRFDTGLFRWMITTARLRENLWLATDHAFKAAVESIARKRAALTNAAAPAEKLADFSKPNPCRVSPEVSAHQIRRSCLEPASFGIPRFSTLIRKSLHAASNSI